MIHHQKNLLLVVNIVHQAKHRVVVNLQVLLLVPPVVNQVVVNQAHQAVLLVQALAPLLVNLVLLVQIHLLVVAHLVQVQARLLAQAAANQALQVPQAAHLLAVNLLAALRVPLVVNQVHLLAVRPLAVLPQVVRPVVHLLAVPLANLVPQAVVHQVRCQLTQLNQSTRDVHIKTTTLTTYITPPLLHLRVPLKY